MFYSDYSRNKIIAKTNLRFLVPGGPVLAQLGPRADPRLWRTRLGTKPLSKAPAGRQMKVLRLAGRRARVRACILSGSGHFLVCRRLIVKCVSVYLANPAFPGWRSVNPPVYLK